MPRERGRRTGVAFVVGTCLAAAVAGQTDPHPTPRQPSTAEQKRGSAEAPTHAPHLVLHPSLAFAHVQAGNAAAVAALAAGKQAPAPAPRPTGAGKYVVAVLVCADADVEVAPLLGLARADVLVVATPGPFASPETAALLERTVATERLCLVVVLGHPGCAAAAARATDVLERRFTAARTEAQRRQQPLPKTLACLQTELLLATSAVLQKAVQADTLRILPAELDARSGRITWHHQRADVMPLAPVK
ncbi:MAG: hypothetical protein JNK15_09105 [Planctomycetes bacterium]|nr:hypothetical protein [Planctomycetota bacterium]